MPRSKGNKKIKFGQLIKYNIKNIKIKYLAQNVLEKIVLDPFIKNQFQGQCLPKYIKTKVVSTCFCFL